MIDLALSRARCLVADGDDGAARDAYLDALRLDSGHPVVLTELGALAHAGGFLSAAREAFRQAVHCQPGYTLGRVGFGDLLNEAGDADAACVQYHAALALDPDMPRAHQGLARAMRALGQNAGEHWRKGFAGHAVVRRRYRGAGTGVPLLLLVSAVGGNVPVGQ
jgi:Tfp pilus assembly protein PilF